MLGQKEYQHTRICAGIYYRAMAQGLEATSAHSAIRESQTSHSYEEREIPAYRVGTPEEMAHQLERQSQAQEKQFDLIHAQQESINFHKEMMTLLLEETKKKSSKRKKKKAPTPSESSESDDLDYLDVPPASKEKSDRGDDPLNRISELEKQLEAIANQSSL